MKTKRVFWIGLGLVLFLTGCGKSPSNAPVSEGMTVIDVQTTSSLAHWLPKISVCANDIPNLGIVSEIVPHTELDPSQTDMTLRLGERLESDPYVSVMGSERLVVVAGDDVPVESISLESLQAIYAGEWESWSSFAEAADLGSIQDLPLRALSYPSGHELELLFR